MNLKLSAINEQPDNTAGVIAVPLSHLFPWDENPRRTNRDSGLDELCASIAAHGLLQSLVVTPADGADAGRYKVIAGERRLKALVKLCEEGRMDAEALIPCRLTDPEQNIAELALAENAVREPMHPADQFEAFMALHRAGQDIAGIAANFGVSEATVAQRMKLAAVSPAVMKAYRDGILNLGQVQAFSITKDHVDQDALLAGLMQQYRIPGARVDEDGDDEAADTDTQDDDEEEDEEDDTGDEQRTIREPVTSIRHALTQKRIKASAPEARFVGLEEYEAAGGTVSRDLFCTDETGVFLDDSKLLHRLVTERAQGTVDDIHAQGWDWVEFRKDFDWMAEREYFRPEREEKFSHLQGTPEQHEHEARIEELLDDVRARWGDAEEGSDEEKKLSARIDELEAEQSALCDEISLTWDPRIKTYAGFVVTLDMAGNLDVRGPLVLKDRRAAFEKMAEEIAKGERADTATRTPDPKEEGGDAPSSPAAVESVKIPGALMETLTGYKTAAIALTMTKRPVTALAAAVHGLICRSHLYRPAANAINLGLTETAYGRNITSPSLDDLRERSRQLQDRLPDGGDPLDLWYWCLSLSKDELLEALALLTALSFDAITAQRRGAYAGQGDTEHGNAIAQTLGIDMADHFTPTAENYFNHVSRDTVLTDLKQALQTDVLDPAVLSLKKGDLAQRAERLVAGTGWIPAPLRVPMPGHEQE